MHPYLRPLQTLFRKHADPIKAGPMRKYMRNQFEFLGIKTPERRELSGQHIAEHGLPEPAQLEPIVRELWQLPEREFQYFGVHLLQRMRRSLPPDIIDTVEHLIITNSWWDTVDALASHTVGDLFARFPALRDEHVARWRAAENMWLRRTTLLFQLRYKQNTDLPLLFELIHENLGSGEFFIQKAIGWALREHSKTDAESVQAFVAATDLAPLSAREALKWMRAKGIVD